MTTTPVPFVFPCGFRIGLQTEDISFDLKVSIKSKMDKTFTYTIETCGVSLHSISLVRLQVPRSISRKTRRPPNTNGTGPRRGREELIGCLRRLDPPSFSSGVEDWLSPFTVSDLHERHTVMTYSPTVKWQNTHLLTKTTRDDKRFGIYSYMADCWWYYHTSCRNFSSADYWNSTPVTVKRELSRTWES